MDGNSAVRPKLAQQIAEREMEEMGAAIDKDLEALWMSTGGRRGSATVRTKGSGVAGEGERAQAFSGDLGLIGSD